MLVICCNFKLRKLQFNQNFESISYTVHNYIAASNFN